MVRLFVTRWYYIINIILVEKKPIIKSNKQNLYSELPLVSTKYIKIDKIRVVANKITLFYHNKAPSEFIVTFQAPFFIRATSENYEPNYEALQVEYCWNHWYFSLSSLCKSYAPKKYYPSANGECGVYIVERRGTSVVGLAVLIDGRHGQGIERNWFSHNPTRAPSMRIGQCRSEDKCIYVSHLFLIFHFFPESDFYLFQ